MTDPKLIEAVARAIAMDHLRLEGVDMAELDTVIAYQPMWFEAMRSHAIAAIAAIAAITASGTHWVAPTTPTSAMIDAVAAQPAQMSFVSMWSDVRTAYLAKPEETTPDGA